MRVERHEWDGADARRLAGLLRGAPAREADLRRDVEATIDAVRERGDAALLELTARHDGVAIERQALRVEPGAMRAALEALDPDLHDALTVARRNVHAIAAAQLTEPATVRAPQGHTVTVAELPVRSAGLYVPGGRAAYPSSALMCCVPARVAGVERIAVASPPGPDGELNPTTLAACSIAGADEVYALGGAQAIAALALGTDTVSPVDVVAGPGNRYVQEAKRQLAGRVGIDGIAGPSELMVVLDGAANTAWAALDLCAQAEHGGDGLLVAVSWAAEPLEQLARELSPLTREGGTPTPCVALVRVPEPGHALELADALAPEHLQLMCEGAQELAATVRTAGCVLTGPGGATAFGDYVAGSNHVLPTGGAGRFAGPLGPRAFRRPLSRVEIPASAAAALAPPLAALARAEGFPLHAQSALARGVANGEDGGR